jgi:hypothetical protein
MLKNLGWDKTSIQYRFNNYGFRSDNDFDIESPSPGPMFIGCSLTMGIGLNIEDIWSHKVHSMIGGTFYNLGQGGAGSETSYRLLKAWVSIVNPTAVYTLGSFEPRRELLSDTSSNWFTSSSKIGAAWFTPHLNEQTEVFKRWFSSDAETEISRHRAFDAIRWVCKENGTPLYSPSRELCAEAIQIANSSFSVARDLKHPGTAFHTHLANNVNVWDKLA